jgi:hypothetical protein
MFKPELGMEFSSIEEAYQFFNMYSWVAGFSIRLGDNYVNKKGVRTMQEYKCQREVCSCLLCGMLFFCCCYRTNGFRRKPHSLQTICSRVLTKLQRYHQPDVDVKL